MTPDPVGPVSFELDLNTTYGPKSFTSPISVAGRNKACAQLTNLTGNRTTAVVTIQKSLDKATWETAGTTLTAAGMSSTIDTTGYAWLRGAVTTAEGSALEAKITLYAEYI